MQNKTLTTLLFWTVVFYALAFIVGLSSSSDFAKGVSNFFFLLGLMAWLPAWFGGLVKQARQSQWGWFIGTIFFGLFCLALYLAIVPETPTYRIYRGGEYYQPQGQPQPHEESVYYSSPRAYQEEPELFDAPQQYQEMVQPESYQEAMQPEFYQELRSSDASQERDR